MKGNSPVAFPAVPDTVPRGVLIADEDKRTENLMRLSFIWGRSGTFSETPEDFACVTEDLRREFAISEDGIRDAMKQSELLNEAWREAADARAGVIFRSDARIQSVAS